jgi:beta-glucanase (GH16 family)
MNIKPPLSDKLLFAVQMITAAVMLCAGIIAVSGCAQSSQESSAQSSGQDGSGTSGDTPAGTLLWSDEFNTSGKTAADAAGKWTYETVDTVGYGWGNNEQETYRASDDNAYVSDGTLKIVALNSGGTWTSARLNSTASMKNVTIEARIKVPVSEGTWPAFWLLPEKKGWPDTGEIDIMEHSPSSWGTGHILTSLHAAGHSGDDCVHIGDMSGMAMDNEWHVYKLVWTSTSMSAYYDGKSAGTPYTRTYDASTGTYSRDSKDWPYNDGKFYIIINLAMGGTIGGTIPSDLKSATMEVDYVRVYAN